MIFDIDKLSKDIYSSRNTGKKPVKSLREAAKEVGINHSVLTRVENGQTPAITTLIKICVWMEVNPGKYFK